MKLISFAGKPAFNEVEYPLTKNETCSRKYTINFTLSKYGEKKSFIELSSLAFFKLYRCSFESIIVWQLLLLKSLMVFINNFLIFILNRFSFKVKEQIKTPKKVYLVDNGFCSQMSSRFSQDFGRIMENLVFVEILRRGYKPNKDVFFYKTKNNKEIDFLLKKGIKIEQLIQVCYRIEKIGTKERESRALIEASQDLDCNNLLVITWDIESEEIIGGKRIKFIPLWKWLLTL